MNATTLPDTIRTDDLLRAFGGAWPPQVLALLNGHTKPKPVPTASVVIDLLDAREFGGRSQIYIASLKHYNKRFAAKFPDMREVTSSVLQTFISSFPAASRRTWFCRVSALFSFAKKRELIEKNPFDALDKPRMELEPPKILTPDQSHTLLKTCPDILRPYLILAMYAGIRPGRELMKMDWSHVNLETATVDVRFPKVRRHRRIVPLEPIAVKLLADCPSKIGKLSPSLGTVNNWHQKARTMLGFTKWPTDLLRHTAASYLLAKYHDAPKVAMMLGNSPAILLTHYHEPVSEADQKTFWTLA